MKSIGKYERLQEIAGGSMGVIYAAYDPVLERDVAIKVLRTAAETDPEIRQRFSREARTCAKLQHSNIVKVYDLGEDEGRIYIVMELLSGMDMRRHIQEKRQLSIPHKIEHMAQVCDALAYAHKTQVVHRDLKPSNIFLTNQHTATVLDFGIAHLPSSTLTIVGKVLGTPNYMAPEQILGRACDARSDLFSSAVVFCEYLTNEHPFQSAFIPSRIVDSEPDSLCSLNSEIPSELEILLFQVLEKSPNRRVQRAEELSQSLRAIAHQMLTESGSSGPVLFGFRTPPAESPSRETYPHTGSSDLAEWRLSEFIRLLRKFDGLIESHSTPEAASVLDEMRDLDRGDGRFTAAVQECQIKLDRVRFDPRNDSAPEELSAEQPPRIVPRLEEEPAPDSAIPTGQRQAFPDSIVQKLRSLVSSLKVGTRQIIWISIGTIALAAVIILLTQKRQPPMLPSLGKATVVSYKAPLRAAAADQSDPSEYLHSGDTVNLLEIPSGPAQKWVKVQFVVGDQRSPALYVATADLGHWTSPDPSAQLSMIKKFNLHIPLNEADAKAQIQELTDFERRFPNSGEKAEADCEITSLYIRAAELGEPIYGGSTEDWKVYLQPAQNLLSATGACKSQPARADDLNRRLEALFKDKDTLSSDKNPEKVSPPLPEPLTPAQREARLQQLQKYWDDGDIDSGVKAARRLMQLDPQNTQAQEWIKKFQNAKAKLEQGG